MCIYNEYVEYAHIFYILKLVCMYVLSKQRWIEKWNFYRNADQIVALGISKFW